jgi:hypothetical protein
MENVKTTTNLALMATVSAFITFCCSSGNAQINYSNSYANSLLGATLIYSNDFTSGSGSVNITNTMLSFSTGILGGSNNAAWLDAGGGGDTNAFFANGTVTTVQGDTWILPFTPRTNYIYTFTATVNITANPGSWITAGYAQNYTVPGIATAAPNSSGLNSCSWTLRNFSGNTEYFSGPGSGTTIYNSTPAGPVNAGTYTYKQILDTTGTKWTIASFFNNVQLGTNFPYASNPTIHALGIGQHAQTTASDYRWISLTLSATPLMIAQQPVSAAVPAGAAFTNTVVAVGTGPLHYQWYTNGVALVNGGSIKGANTNALIISSVSAANVGADYYVVVTNLYGSATSSVASLVVGPTVANIVTNDVTSGLTWKIAITNLAAEAGWSDPNGYTLTLSGVNSVSANGTNMVYDANYIYYNGAVTAEDHFGYTITDGFLTTNGTMYLEAVSTPEALAISSPGVDGSGNPTFSGHGIPNYIYGVESATSLSGPWSEAGSVTADLQGSWSFTDASQTNPTIIFYRLYFPDNPSNPPQ